MTYFDTFIRDCVNYAYPDGTVAEKYKMRKTMAKATQEEPERPQPTKPTTTPPHYRHLDLD